MSVATETIGAGSSMQDVLAAFPGARRALFRRYHIGGCSSCGFEMSETLGALCQRNGGLNVSEVVEHIRTSHELDKQMEISPKEVAERRQRGETVRLLDIRTREEWEAVKIEGAEFVNQELVQSVMGKTPREALLVFYDHDGSASLDAVAYFAGHGFTNAKYMKGGIDGWSQEVDGKIPRYRLQKS